MKAYFISGLGADERVFQFLDLPGIEKIYIKWIDPEEQESLASYANRLTAQIDLTQEVILVGISFGGIVAQEIAKIKACKKIILISSIKSPQELSWQLSLVSFCRVYRLFPAKVLKWSNALTVDYYFSTTSKTESKLLHQIIKETDDRFMIWAIDRLMTWKNPNPQADIIHIHGTADRIFPISPIKSCIKVQGGGHFMVVNKSVELSKIIMENI
jgi:pimeloyl-ACP methyl ester carboxylesterase